MAEREGPSRRRDGGWPSARRRTSTGPAKPAAPGSPWEPGALDPVPEAPAWIVAGILRALVRRYTPAPAWLTYVEEPVEVSNAPYWPDLDGLYPWQPRRLRR